MATHLLSLRQISLTFGGTPLLDGAALDVAAGRPHLPGRPQRLGQVDADADRGRPCRARQRRALRPSRRQRALSRRRRPISPAIATVLDLRRRPASIRSTSRGRAACLIGESALTPRCRSRAPFGRRGAPRGARAGAGRRARCAAARRADQPSRPARHRVAGGRLAASRAAHRADQPRPALAGDPVAHHRVARSRPHARPRRGLRALRGVA